jgi:oligoribonuclease NrnB/cAMP/cGMP phosphodiesterase (DHH superfamily)
MSVVIISHRKDLDGLSSAALMVRYFTKHRPLPFYLTLRDYPDGSNIIEDRLLDIKGSEIYLADLATDQKFIDEVVTKLRRLKANNNKIVWMDHHPTREDIAASIKRTVDLLDLRESTTTGSETVYDRLYRKNSIKDEHAELLARLGHDSDLMEMKISVTQKLVMLIDYYNFIDAGTTFYPDLIQLVLYLAAPKKEADPEAILMQDHLQQLTRYKKLLEKEKKRVFENVEIVNTGGYKFAIFKYPTIFSGTRISAEVLSNFEVDASIGYSQDGSGSVRRNNSSVSCRQIAKLLGGGGHEFAAGFSLGFEINNKGDDSRARQMIIEALKKIYQ